MCSSDLKGKNYGDTGPNDKIMMGGKKSLGVTNENLKSMGRNMARVANQRGR